MSSRAGWSGHQSAGPQLVTKARIPNAFLEYVELAGLPGLCWSSRCLKVTFGLKEEEDKMVELVCCSLQSSSCCCCWRVRALLWCSPHSPGSPGEQTAQGPEETRHWSWHGRSPVETSPCQGYRSPVQR